eukprot:11244101-Alexandrium_andersonii.AAC.1
MSCGKQPFWLRPGGAGEARAHTQARARTHTHARTRTTRANPRTMKLQIQRTAGETKRLKS